MGVVRNDIPAGTFIGEFTGELIPDSSARDRLVLYETAGVEPCMLSLGDVDDMWRWVCGVSHG